MLVPGKGGRTFVATFIAATVASAIGAGSAFGVAQTIVANDDVFVPPTTYTMDQGDRPTLQNAGVNQHNVTSRDFGPDADFLFISPTIGTGTTTVEGTQYLTTGTYAFICTTHPLSMSGNLQVSSAGSPAARPRIDVILGGATLSKLAKKGKLPLTVKAPTESNGVELEVKLGKAVIGTQKPFNLAAGSLTKLSVKLTKSGKSKLAKKDSAKIKVTGEVPFGSPDTAKRTYK